VNNTVVQRRKPDVVLRALRRAEATVRPGSAHGIREIQRLTGIDPRILFNEEQRALKKLRWALRQTEGGTT
jgi:hypothetical protein